jgi:pimeloyl-ACP methyl ester carboxylesterase
MKPRIIFFPGLGADARLLDAQRAINAEIEVPAWIEPLPRESLAEYSRRLAATIDTSTPFYVGGISFGGMIAQEVARHTSPQGLILISTCRRGRDLRRLRHAMLLPAYVTPPVIVSMSKWTMTFMRHAFGVVTAEQARLMNDMLYATGSSFVLWCLRAIHSWQGADGLHMPILQIHGRKDRIIPLRGVKPDHVIDGAGHIVNMTHPEEVNQVISRWIDPSVTGASSPVKSAQEATLNHI